MRPRKFKASYYDHELFWFLVLALWEEKTWRKTWNLEFSSIANFFSGGGSKIRLSGRKEERRERAFPRKQEAELDILPQTLSPQKQRPGFPIWVGVELKIVVTPMDSRQMELYKSGTINTNQVW